MQPNTSLARYVMVFPSLDYCVLYHFPWEMKLKLRVGERCDTLSTKFGEYVLDNIAITHQLKTIFRI